MQGRFVAYYRVSTAQQGRSGLGLDAQRVAVLNYLNGGASELLDEFTEVESGKRDERPELARALEACRKAKATLVAKLDRLSRDLLFIATLMKGKVDFVAVDFPTANRLTLHIMAAFAEHERDMISQRTKDALQAAKARGKALGWAIPDRREEHARASRQGATANRARADRHAGNVVPVIRQIEAAGIGTLQGIAGALNARGIATARGGKWHAMTGWNLLRREHAA